MKKGVAVVIEGSKRNCLFAVQGRAAAAIGITSHKIVCPDGGARALQVQCRPNFLAVIARIPGLSVVASPINDRQK